MALGEQNAYRCSVMLRVVCVKASNSDALNTFAAKSIYMIDLIYQHKVFINAFKGWERVKLSKGCLVLSLSLPSCQFAVTTKWILK